MSANNEDPNDMLHNEAFQDENNSQGKKCIKI